MKNSFVERSFHSGVDESLGKLTTVVNLLQRTESSFPTKTTVFQPVFEVLFTS